MTTDTSTVRPAGFAGELRSGNWTRLGDQGVLGDKVTEEMLSDIAARAKTAAQAQGYAIGWAEGRRAAEEQGRAEVARLYVEATAQEERRQKEHEATIEALRTAIAEVRAAASSVCDAVESQATDLAIRLTEAIIGRELKIAVDPGADAVRRALQLLPDESLVTVHMNAEDLHTTDTTVLTSLGATMVADATLGRGDVVVVADDHVVDGRVDEALARVQGVLGT